MKVQLIDAGVGAATTAARNSILQALQRQSIPVRSFFRPKKRIDMSTATVMYKPQGPEFDPETNEPRRNWTKTNNRLVEKLATKVSGKLQTLLLLHIARNTYGCNPVEPWTRLMHSKIAKQFGATREAVSKVIDDAIDRRLIDELDRGGRGRNARRLYRLTQWDQVKPYRADKPTAHQSNEASVRFSGSIMPGRSSGWIQLPLFVSEKPDPNFPLKVYNRVNQLVEFRFEHTETGYELHILPGSNLNQTRDPDTRKRVGTDIAVSSPSTDPDSVRDSLKQFKLPAEYREFLQKLWGDVWERGISDQQIRSILAHVEGAPVDYFERQLIVRFGDRYREKLVRHNPNLLVKHIAPEIGANWKAAKATRTPVKPLTQMTGEELRAHMRSLSPEDYAELVRQHPALAIDGLDGLQALQDALEEVVQ
jgi:hypothetical protein